MGEIKHAECEWKVLLAWKCAEDEDELAESLTDVPAWRRCRTDTLGLSTGLRNWVKPFLGAPHEHRSQNTGDFKRCGFCRVRGVADFLQFEPMILEISSITVLAPNLCMRRDR